MSSGKLQQGGQVRRTVLWLAALAAVAGAGIWGWQRWHRDDAKGPKFTTAKIDRGRIVASVTATGTLSALVTVQVGSQVSGRIRDLYVDFNAPVRKGQVLARIDPELFQAALAQAEANHLVAKADLAAARVRTQDAQRQLQRTRDLAERKLVAPAELDTAQANFEAMQAGVEAAEGRIAQTQAALQQTNANLNYTTIQSPIAGIVISRNVDVGQTVAASLQAPVLFLIAEDLRKMQVDTHVAEADVGKLHAGMAAEFGIDAYPGERFVGSVRQVRNAPQTLQNVVTYDAVIDVANDDLRLKPGMTANVTFVYAQREGILRVPNTALRFRMPEAALPPGSSKPAARRNDARRSLWLLRSGKPLQLWVRTGVTDGSLTELLAPEVREGDQAIVEATVSGGAPAGMPVRRMM